MYVNKTILQVVYGTIYVSFVLLNNLATDNSVIIKIASFIFDFILVNYLIFLYKKSNIL